MAVVLSTKAVAELPATMTRPPNISPGAWIPFPASWRPNSPWPPYAELAGNTDEHKFYRSGVEHQRRRDLGGFRTGQSPVGRKVIGSAPCARSTRYLTSRHFTTALTDQRGDSVVRPVDEGEVTEEQIRDAARRISAAPTEPRVLQIRALVLGGAGLAPDSKASTNHILGFRSPVTAAAGCQASLQPGPGSTQRHRATRWWTWPAKIRPGAF